VGGAAVIAQSTEATIGQITATNPVVLLNQCKEGDKKQFKTIKGTIKSEPMTQSGHKPQLGAVLRVCNQGSMKIMFKGIIRTIDTSRKNQLKRQVILRCKPTESNR
jgi:hypothetical protein